MKPVIVLALKDIKLLYRDKMGLFWLLAFPLFMALFFGSIFSSGGDSSGRAAMKIAIVDQDRTDFSNAFIDHLDSSSALKVIRPSADSSRLLVRKGKAIAFLIVKPGFGNWQNIFSGDTNTTLVAGIDQSRQAESGYLKGLIIEAWFAQLQSTLSNPSISRSLVSQSINSIANDDEMPANQATVLKNFLSQLDIYLAQSDTGVLSSQSGNQSGGTSGIMKGPKITQEDVFREQSGPRTSWEITFPQALLWALIGCSAAFAITIVNERTKGTLTRLRMAPISRAHILAGKGGACFLTAITVCFLLIVIAKLIFSIRTPDIIGLALAIVCTSICFTGLMMLISVMGKTEQAVAGAGWAILLVFSMTGGGMIPLMFMPKWMLTISHISPVKWGIYSLEGAIWRGFGVQEMLLPLGILTGIGLVTFTIGVMIFRRTD